MGKVTHVMAISSAGGHWIQLRRLRPAWKGMRVTYVCTDAGLRDLVLNEAMQEGEPTPAFKVITEANRWQKLRLVRQLIQLTIVFVVARPDVVITTGAAPGYFAILLGKLFRARTVWIDSIANAEELSLSGQKAGKIADLWVTQWPDLAGPDGPDYIGSVL